MVVFHSDQPGQYDPKNLSAYHLGALVSFCEAIFLINNRRRDAGDKKDVLRSLSNELATIRGRADLLRVIGQQLKKLLRYTDASLIILK